jgi:hypothetical protein
MILCPAVENLGERGSLPTSGRQALLQHEHQHDIAFGGKVRDIRSNNRPAFRPGGRGHLRVVGRSETGLSDMEAVGLMPRACLDLGGGHCWWASYCWRYLLMPGAAMGMPAECAVSSMRLS